MDRGHLSLGGLGLVAVVLGAAVALVLVVVPEFLLGRAVVWALAVGLALLVLVPLLSGGVASDPLRTHREATSEHTPCGNPHRDSKISLPFRLQRGRL